jgi:hypothetical protein
VASRIVNILQTQETSSHGVESDARAVPCVDVSNVLNDKKRQQQSSDETVEYPPFARTNKPSHRKRAFGTSRSMRRDAHAIRQPLLRVNPTRETTCTLLATGVAGENVSASFTLLVKAAPLAILFVKSIRGRSAEVSRSACAREYLTPLLSRSKPVHWIWNPRPGIALVLHPLGITTYSLIALGADGRKDRETFTSR